jgi:hypothetical protein
VKLGHLRFIFKGQLSILLRLLEFVRNRELLKLSNKAIAENPHAQLGALLSSCAPLASRASVAHLRCALRDLTWVTLSQYCSRKTQAHIFFDVNKHDVEGTRQKRLVVSDRVTAYTTVARTFPEL